MGLRSWSRWSQAILWAEDAPLFLGEAISRGALGLFESYRGYYHFLPKLLSWLSLHLFGIENFGISTNIAGILIFCAVLAQLASDDYSEIFGNLRSRITFALGLSFVPGLGEVLGNPTNLHWVLTLSLGLLGLKNRHHIYTYRAYLWIFLVGASAGEALCFVPLFAFRWWKTQLPRKITLVLPVAILLFWGLMNFIVRDRGGEAQNLNIHLLLKSFPHSLINYLVLQPLVGDKMTEIFAEHISILYWIVGLGGVLYALNWSRRTQKNSQHLWVYVLCAYGVLALMWIARQDAANFFALMKREVYYSWLRYSFLIGAAAFIAWAYIIAHSGRNYSQRRLTIFVGIYALLALPRWEIRTPMPGLSFRTQIKNHQPPQCGGSSTLHTYPPSWQVEIPNSFLCTK